MKVCSKCKKEVKKLKVKNPPTCEKCYIIPKKICSICKEINIIKTYIDKQPICNYCYSNYGRPRKNCSICKKINIVKTYIDKQPVCTYCYKKHGQPKKGA